MKRWYSIGEAARRLKLSPEHLRKLDKAGELRAQRTKGKHRRYSESAVAAYERRLEAAKGTRSRKRTGKAPARRRPAGPPLVADPFEDDLDLAPDDAVLFNDDLAPPGASPAPLPPAPLAPAQNDGKRLQELKHYGMQCLPYSIPSAWKGIVVADLDAFVTAQQIPSWLPWYEQQSLVEERVKALVKRYRDEQDRAREAEVERRRAETARALAQAEAETAKRKAEEERRRAEASKQERVRALIAHGLQYLGREVTDWDIRDRSRVRSEVEKGLQEEVRADWTDRQVERWVDDELDHWEEDEPDED